MAKKRKNKKKKKNKKKEKKDAIQEGEIELLGRTDEQPRPSQGSNGNSGHVVVQMYHVQGDLLHYWMTLKIDVKIFLIRMKSYRNLVYVTKLRTKLFNSRVYIVLKAISILEIIIIDSFFIMILNLNIVVIRMNSCHLHCIFGK